MQPFLFLDIHNKTWETIITTAQGISISAPYDRSQETEIYPESRETTQEFDTAIGGSLNKDPIVDLWIPPKREIWKTVWESDSLTVLGPTSSPDQDQMIQT